MKQDMGFNKERLKQLRSEFDVTQKDFSAAIGCTSASLSAYENGSKIPPTQTLINIAIEFHCSVDWLLGLSDNMNHESYKGNRPAFTYSEYIERLFSLYGSGIALGIKCDCINDRKNMSSNEGITFQDPVIKVFLRSWKKIIDLCEERTIDETMYDAWAEKVIRDFDYGRILEDSLDYTWFEQNYIKHSEYESEYEATLSALRATFHQAYKRKEERLYELADDPGEQ